MKDNVFTAAEDFVESRLVPPLIHGDTEHQEWLKTELRKWVYDMANMLMDFREHRFEDNQGKCDAENYSIRKRS